MNIAKIELELTELIKKLFESGIFVFRVLDIYDAPTTIVTKLRQGIRGAKADRPGFTKSIAFVRKGDDLVIWKYRRADNSVPSAIDFSVF